MNSIDKILMKEAKKAYRKKEVPVGCVITKNSKVIAKSYNLKETKKCCLEHAELIAIKKASKKNKSWRLNDCELYVTLEPCEMCKNAIKQSRIKKVYYILDSNYNNEKASVINYEKTYGYISKEYQILLKNFFEEKR